mmetsp:Transcript_25270/g.28101  ORF Transcript_25270/g.28101 Transcript_25270/m.28101 type:complete len:237 (+) Transcript_25270:33-743(+)
MPSIRGKDQGFCAGKQRVFLVVAILASMALLMFYFGGAEYSVFEEEAIGQTFKDVVVFHTKYGNIVWQFFPKDAPKTVENFKELTRRGFFDHCTFYRANPRWVLQGGCHKVVGVPGKTWKQSPLPGVPFEYKLNNDKMYISMARGADINGATSEFAIQMLNNTVGNGPRPDGNPGYAVFAKVVAGVDIVHLICSLPTTEVSNLLMLVEPVEFKKVVLLDTYTVTEESELPEEEDKK